MKKLFLLFIAAFMLAALHASSQTVYCTSTGQKYHTAKCKMISKTSESLTLDQALIRRLQPCPKCHPPTTPYKKSPAKKKTAAKAPAKKPAKK